MLSSYLNEAFQQLNLLQEAEINLKDDDAFDEMQSVMDTEAYDDVMVVTDTEADDEESLSDNYVGKVILDCVVCHSKIYKDPNEITLNEDESLANVDEECPYCYTTDGYKIIGEIAPFDDEYVAEDPDSEEVEEEEPDLEESLSLILSRLTEAEMSDEDKKDTEILRGIQGKIDKRANVALTSEEKEVLRKYGLNRYDKNLRSDDGSPLFPHYGDRDKLMIHPRVNVADRARKMSDRYAQNDRLYRGDHMSNSDSTSEHDKDYRRSITYQRRENQAVNALMQDKVNSMKNALSSRKFNRDVYGKAEDKYGRKVRDAEQERDRTLSWSKQGMDRAQSAIDKLLKRGDMEEALTNVTVRSDNEEVSIDTSPEGNMSVSTNDGQGTDVSVQVVAPISTETESDILLDPEEEIPEEEFSDIDEFDEEAFDRLGESYLKTVYDNVSSYHTRDVYCCGNSLILEGVIGFNSGRRKATKFVFEKKHSNSKSVRMLGENKTFSRGKKSFSLRGSMSGKTFVCESLTYNYRGKDARGGKSQHLYGTVKL